MEQRELREFEKVDSVSLTAPACRMLAIFAAAKPSPNGSIEASVFFEPVVALRAVTKRYFSHGFSYRRDLPCSDDAAAQEGWRMSNSCLDMEPIICDSEAGLIGIYEQMEDWKDAACHVVACPWPLSQDDDRLSGPIEVTKQRAIQNYEVRRRSFERKGALV
jgi:hypothetical protein